MTTVKKATVTQLRNEILQGTKFRVCPCCGCRDLLKFGSDHFCMSCDWNSVLHDVNSGNFEKRIGLMSKYRTCKTNGEGEVIFLNELAKSAANPAPIKRTKP